MWRHYLFLALAEMRKAPWLTVLMILTMAVGVSTSMTTLALRHALAGDPIPQKSSRLLNLQIPGETTDDKFTYAQAGELLRLGANQAQSLLTAAGVGSIARQDGTERVNGIGIRYATRSFFPIFNVPLQYGRTWTKQEAVDHLPVAVIDQSVASDYFGNGSAIGQQIQIDHTLFTVIGVAAHWNPQPHFFDLSLGAFGGGGDAVYVPVTAVAYAPDNAIMPMTCVGTSSHLPKPSKVSQLLESTNCQWLSVWYLAKSPQATDAMKRTVLHRLSKIIGPNRAIKMHLLNVHEVLEHAGVIPGSVRLYSLLGLVFLLLCVVNAAGMQLSRLLRGTSQIGVRRALGARRIDIVQQYLCDTLLVGCTGGALGLVLTIIAIQLLHAIPARYVNYSGMIHLDKGMYLLMLLVILATSVLAGLVPAVIASRTDPAFTIKTAQ